MSLGVKWYIKGLFGPYDKDYFSKLEVDDSVDSYGEKTEERLQQQREENIEKVFQHTKKLFSELFDGNGLNDNSCWVETKTGRRYNILNSLCLETDLSSEEKLTLHKTYLSEEDLWNNKFYLSRDLWSALEKTTRYNGNKHISVSQHLEIAFSLAKVFFPFSDEIQREVLIHDLHEAIVGDLIFPVRKMFPKFEELEGNISERLKLLLFPDYVGSKNSIIEESVNIIDHLTFLVEKAMLGFRSDEEWNLNKRNFDTMKKKLISNITNFQINFDGHITKYLDSKYFEENTEKKKEGIRKSLSKLKCSDFEFQRLCLSSWEHKDSERGKEYYEGLVNRSGNLTGGRNSF